MVTLNRKYKSIVSFVTAFAILWMVMASIINFHMERIYGKHIMEQNVAIIKSKDDKRDAANFAHHIFKKINSQELNYTLALAIIDDNLSSVYFDQLDSFLSDGQLLIKPTALPDRKNFRGPPSIA